MRRVEVQKVTWPVVGGVRKRTTEVIYEGWFHGWGLEAADGGNDTWISSSVAIVEKDDGQVEMPPADLVKFKEPLR